MVIKLNYRLISIVIFSVFAVTTFGVSLYSYVAATEKEGKLRMPIIMYHQIKSFGLGEDVITVEEFEEDLKFLKENNYTTITMTDLIGYVYDDLELPDNPIILTFDDGYFDNYKKVLPLLKEYNAKIVLSIIGKTTDEFSQYNDEKERVHMNWKQVKEMADSGYAEIQNHTYDLHSSSKKGRIGSTIRKGESVEKYEEVLTEDLVKLQEGITAVVGTTPNTFVYPYGRSSKESDEILKRIGFKATLLCGGRINYISKDPNCLFGLTRLRRGHKISIGKLIK